MMVAESITTQPGEVNDTNSKVHAFVVLQK